MEIGGDRGFSHGKWGFLMGSGGHSGVFPWEVGVIVGGSSWEVGGHNGFFNGK